MRSEAGRNRCEPGCAIGAIHHGDGTLGTVIAEFGAWRVSVLARLAYPGWLIVAPERHVETFGELEEDESHDFADLVGRLDRAIRADLVPAKVYLLALGDSMPHWHLLMAPVSKEAYAAGARGATVLTSYPAEPDLLGATRRARQLTSPLLL